jgi:hypothetical protein
MPAIRKRPGECRAKSVLSGADSRREAEFPQTSAWLNRRMLGAMSEPSLLRDGDYLGVIALNIASASSRLAAARWAIRSVCENRLGRREARRSRLVIRPREAHGALAPLGLRGDTTPGRRSSDARPQ